MEDKVIKTSRKKKNYNRDCVLKVLILCLSTLVMLFFHANNQAESV